MGKQRELDVAEGTARCGWQREGSGLAWAPLPALRRPVSVRDAVYNDARHAWGMGRCWPSCLSGTGTWNLQSLFWYLGEVGRHS
jgi:hypothetical protein